MKIKKILKITSGVIVFFSLPSLLFFAYLYFKYNEDLPQGQLGPEADALAFNMQKALNAPAYEATDYLEWTFKKRHHFKWHKTENTCEVYWKNIKVFLDFDAPQLNKAFENDVSIEGESATVLIEKAIFYFNNDSFWLVAPYKVFDKGVERRLVTLENEEQALLVTFTSGGSTPGDSYLWQFDSTGKPKSFKMWTSLLPIQGLEASWAHWTTTDTGVHLPIGHNILALGLEINDIKTNQDTISSTSNSKKP